MLVDARMLRPYMTGTGRTILETLPVLPSDARLLIHPECESRFRGWDVVRSSWKSERAIAAQGLIGLRHAPQIQFWLYGPVGGRAILGVYDLIPLRLGGLKRSLLTRRLGQLRRHPEVQILTLSEDTRTRLVDEFGISSQQVFVARPGVDHMVGPVSGREDGAAGRPASPSQGAAGVVCIGRNSPHKNLDTLTRAWERTQGSARPKLTLVVPPEDASSKKLRRWRAAGVDIRSGLSQGDLSNLIASAAAVAVPSLEEGYGLPLVEAIASGVPVLASDIASFREMPTENVVWLPAADEGAWAEGLREVQTGRLKSARWANAASLPTWDDWRSTISERIASIPAADGAT